MFTTALFTKDKNQTQSKFISWRMNKTKCYPHKGILFSREKDWSSDSCYWYIWQHGWTSETLCQLKEARNKGLYIVWYYLYEIFRKGKTIGQISGCLEPEEGAERLAVNRYKGTVGVMEAFLVIVVRLDKFTKAHVNVHLNGWLSWHINYTSKKQLIKWMASQICKFSLRWLFKKLDYIADFIAIILPWNTLVRTIELMFCVRCSFDSNENGNLY